MKALCVVAALVAAFLCSEGWRARAHDAHLALSVEDQKVYEFYSTWEIPAKGDRHRAASCCDKVDCFPVSTIRLSAGRYHVRVQTPSGESNEYVVDPAQIESNQKDPRESPDGKSHACIQFGKVVCFVEGSGI